MGKAVCSKVHKHSNSVLNNEEQPEQSQESITVLINIYIYIYIYREVRVIIVIIKIYHCYQTHTILLNILLSWLIPHTQEIIHTH